MDLSDQAEKDGVLQTIRNLGFRKAPIPYSDRLTKLSIDELNLTVRSNNGLKWANTHTFGKLRELLEMENGLLNVRNIGQKSVREIK